MAILGASMLWGGVGRSSISSVVRVVAAVAIASLFACAHPGQNASRAPARPGDSDLILAVRLMRGDGMPQNVAAGVALVEHTAEAGHPTAQLMIGRYYATGYGVEKNSEKSVQWLQKAADQNVAAAQADLAFIYLVGDIAPKDYGRAFQFASAAAAQGDAMGHLALYRMYADGLGVKKNGDEALKHLTQAASKSSALAMIELGAAYRDGKIVKVDHVASYAWFDVALRNASGVERAAALRSRDQAGLLLLPEELATAQRLSASWKPGSDMMVQAKPATSQPAQLDRIFTTQRATAPLVNPSEVGVTGKALHYDYVVRADGGYTFTLHREATANNRASVQQLGQAAIPYSDSMDVLTVKEAVTIKRDGRRLPVSADAMMVQSPAANLGYPLFSDQRQKVIIFPNVDVGDTVSLTVEIVSKPRLPGGFEMGFALEQQRLEKDVRITVRAPKSLPLTTETYDMKFNRKNSGNDTVYEWHWENNTPVREDIIALNAIDRLPRLFASSFRSYQDFADAYGQLAIPKIVVTPAVQKLADDITRGVSDKRRQAELLYNWVSHNIRYVLVILGNDGSLIPHDVDTILSNAYGDCKDHSVLFAALLQAKGIRSELVLLNAGNSFSLANPPTLASLNHAITWLPDFDLYADTTSGVAPFGVLPLSEYGKPAIHVGTAGGTVRRTPLLRPDDATVSMKSTSRLDADGRFKGESVVEATGAFAVGVREVASRIDAAGNEQSAANWLRSIGSDGTGHFTYSSPFEPSSDYKVAGTFETAPRRGIMAGDSFIVPRGLSIGWLPGDDLIGPLDFKDSVGIEPTPCRAGRQRYQASVELPEGTKVRQLPQGTTIENKFFSYRSTWSQSGRTVTVTREMWASPDEPVCVGDLRRSAAKALNDIRADYNTGISLVKISGSISTEASKK